MGWNALAIDSGDLVFHHPPGYPAGDVPTPASRILDNVFQLFDLPRAAVGALGHPLPSRTMIPTPNSTSKHPEPGCSLC